MRELYHYNHNHDALGRFASSIGGSIRSRSSEYKSRRQNSIQYQRRAVKKQRVEDYKNRRLLSNEELQERINRLSLEKRYRELADADIHPGKEYVDSIVKSKEFRKEAIPKAASIGRTVASNKRRHKSSMLVG